MPTVTVSSPSSSSLSSSPLSHLSPPDRTLFTQYGFGQSRPVEYINVHQGFERWVDIQPDAIAVEHRSYGDSESPFHDSVTYSQLNNLSNALARRLRQNHDIVPGTRVCLLARRSVALIVGILGVLKAGAQYVPLDGMTITDETLGWVINDSSAKVVLAMPEYLDRVPGAVELLVDGSGEEEEEAVEDLSNPDGDDGCYCIYTSGTTGRPKGVDVRHRGVANVLSTPLGSVGMAPGVRVAQLLNIAFDMGAWEILGSLFNGATLCIRGNSKREWVQLMKTVQVVIATPSVLAVHEPKEYPGLRRVIVGGEPCSQALADKWASQPDMAFHNCCGPTEISVCNTVQPHNSVGYSLSIGRPLENTSVYILEAAWDPEEGDYPSPVPIGHVGTMWVGGIGVSRGYLNLEERTQERWRVDPFVADRSGWPWKRTSSSSSSSSGPLMFNTGDLARWRPDGQLEHMGRADDQVKHKGFRVELDGVSEAMKAHPDVTTAVTLLVNGELCGFLCPGEVDLAAVRAQVQKTQPYYAVPTRYIALDEWPTTANGKADKRVLRKLVEEMLSESPVASPTRPISSRMASFPSSSTPSRQSTLSSPSASPPKPESQSPVPSEETIPQHLSLNHSNAPRSIDILGKITSARWTPPLTPKEVWGSSMQQASEPIGESSASTDTESSTETMDSSTDTSESTSPSSGSSIDEDECKETSPSVYVNDLCLWEGRARVGL
ncbi:hypothetical protein C8J56DRAFT_890368 [Mycena floridula]|nr:hypothetical protein C8J56DRAFT_890368 [Mycena floridula]